MMFCPCAGWTLAEGGQMVQGATGYLIDENGYYILEDGRRVSDEIIIESRYGEKDIRIGNKEVSEGLFEIMNARSLLPVKTVYNDARQLLDRYRYYMPLVVQQAFQINACYAKPNGIQNPLALGSNAKFYSIGTDETDIPIVVTQVGEDGPDKKKLVIAGPHGDERNAQRLIMSAQNYFIDKDLPADTVLYFIPCLSPTMCFADARGIPVVDKDGKKLPLPEAKSRITIPYLHNLIASQVPKNTDVPDDTALLRTLMQSGNGKATDDDYPKYGIDANRDINFDLKSNMVFKSFIVSLYRGTNTSRKIETEVKIYDPEDRIYHKMGPQFTAANMQVFMIHGYYASGMIYGPYFCKEKEPKQSWPAAMSDTDKDRVNTMLGLLFGRLNQRKYSIGPNSVRGTSDDPHLYEETEYDARDYQGEWVKVLPGIGIWSIDIELPGRFAVQSYDEGIRNDDTGERPYGPLLVGDLSKELFKMEEENRFVNLIKDRAIWP
jgi:hypothetical protein